ncbi:MAG: hypothetical protein FWD85_07420 [Microbacteriaceae bacterium]|nr:hypothetical protein [Microbacteriaceae bacterium]MCL2795121.1 hypothetical protein [Microbacteriaceae bacterium]
MRRLWTGSRLAPAIIVGLLAGGAVWYFGASPWWAAPVGIVAAAGVFVWRALPHIEDPVWPSRLPETAVGARDDVQLLGWAIAGRRGRVQPRAVDRVRHLAAQRLERHRLDLDAASDRDRVVALIGEPAYLTLHASNVATMPSQRELLACLDALDRLDPPVRRD